MPKIAGLDDLIVRVEPREGAFQRFVLGLCSGRWILVKQGRELGASVIDRFVRNEASAGGRSGGGGPFN